MEEKNNSNESEQTQVTQEVTKGKKKNIFLIIFLLLILFVSGAAAYYFMQESQLLDDEKQVQKDTNGNQTTPVDEPTALFSGTLTKLDESLNLFQNENGVVNEEGEEFVDDCITHEYYTAGEFLTGEFEGYTRVIAVEKLDCMFPSTLKFVLATQDFEQYMLDLYRGYEDPFEYLDEEKILGLTTFDTYHTREIVLNDTLSLYAGNEWANVNIGIDTEEYTELDWNNPYVDFFWQPLEYPENFMSDDEGTWKEVELLRQKYVLGSTAVTVVDSTGLNSLYYITTPERISIYHSEIVEYEELRETEEYTPRPDNPTLGFDVGSINENMILEFFNAYETAIPQACAFAVENTIMDLDEDELEEIGIVYNLPLYRLQDPEHEIYELAFKNKMHHFEDYPEAFESVNPDMQQPTFEEYVEKNPLLFVQDFWGRWVGLGEFDIHIAAGCGKPVIYLYPEVDTEVKVEFKAPIQFEKDIPTYENYWHVLAKPNGLLENLRSELTDCNTIDFSKKGSEYAKEACETNTYPYLYWSGNVISQNYPRATEGWVVHESKLEAFLNSKLFAIGLNESEKNDFVEYWLPELQAKNSPYYRISFLQTEELNALFPMQVTPQPQSMLRIFMDYATLSQKPDYLVKPQKFEKFERNGFTLVEWGGLK